MRLPLRQRHRQPQCPLRRLRSHHPLRRRKARPLVPANPRTTLSATSAMPQALRARRSSATRPRGRRASRRALHSCMRTRSRARPRCLPRAAIPRFPTRTSRRPSTTWSRRPSKLATYAIGDLQGCYEPLRRLVDALQFDPARDRLWFTGDLVNRGPQSLECLRYVRSLGDSAVTVFGNHDFHLLCVAEGVEATRKRDTLVDILDAPDRDELLDWLRARPLIHVEDGWALVHAGLLPQWSVARAKELAGEVESTLRGKSYRKFLARMYGDEPRSWSDRLEGWDRLR